jgi:hypothetical protein
MTSHAAYEELAAGYALDALEPEDEQAFTEHLEQGCPECEAVLANFRAAAADLAELSDQVEPPPSILAAIRREIAAETPDPVPAALIGSMPDVSTTGPGRQRRRRPGRVASPATRRPGRQLSVTVSMRALGLVLLAAVVALGAVLGVRAHDSSVRTDTALAQAQTILRHLDDSSASLVRMTGTGAAKGAAVVDGRHVYLVAQDLGSNNPHTSIYVLWAERSDGQMTAVRGFDVAHSGVTLIAGTLPASVTRAIGFAVSRERGTTIPRSPSHPILSPV